MVVDRVTDGKRIAELLASELDGRSDPPLDRLAVVNADRAVEGTTEGARAYDVERDGETFATVFVHEDRARVELRDGLDAARETATAEGLRVRPKAVTPPRLLLFVESGAAVKRAVTAVAAAVETDDATD